MPTGRRFCLPPPRQRKKQIWKNKGVTVKRKDWYPTKSGVWGENMKKGKVLKIAAILIFSAFVIWLGCIYVYVGTYIFPIAPHWVTQLPPNPPKPPALLPGFSNSKSYCWRFWGSERTSFASLISLNFFAHSSSFGWRSGWYCRASFLYADLISSCVAFLSTPRTS